MAFTIRLYNVSDDPRKLNKTLTGEVVVSNVRPTDTVDLMNPSFILNYDENYTTKNYLWAAAPFNRFYFITDMKIDIGKKIVISCAVDVLLTYASNIGSITANIIRLENGQEPYLVDSEYKIKAGFVPFYDVFTGGESRATLFNEGDYVLNWIGGDYEDRTTYIPITEEPSDWNTSWSEYYVMREFPNMEKLGDVYPSAQGVPSFTTIRNTWGSVYKKIET